MKTIFITSFHQLIFRNILSTPLLELLLQGGDVCIVLLALAEKTDFFKNEFGRESVVVEGVSRGLTRRDIFLRYLAWSAINTRAIEVIRKAEFDRIGSHAIRVLGQIRWGQRMIRGLDRLLTPRGRFTGLFNKYKPVLVLATDVQNENDVRLLHEAKDQGVPAVGMVRSWDNFTTKGPLRVFPDILVVPNEIVRREAVTLSFMPEDRIVPVGIPHYDRYLESVPELRDAFCQQYGLNPARKIILFSPIGNRYIKNNLLDKLVLETLSELDVNILVRIPPSDYVALEGFKTRKAQVAFDVAGAGSENDRKLNEMTKEDDDRLISELMNCDVMVTGQSTITIDASIFNKPTVIIYFDQEERQYFESVKRYYDSEYYRPVAESGGVRFAKSPGELQALVEQYLENPRLDEEGRGRIAEEQAYSRDGNSTERLANVLLQELKTKV